MIVPSQVNLEFLGSTFPTRLGGVLKVVNILGKDSNSTARFGLECSICSKDVELWPSGSIFGTKANITRGAQPCGCSSAPKWNKTQYEIRVKRECKVRGYTFIQLGKWGGKDTKIELHNPKTGNTWKSTSINNFLLKGYGDPVVGRELIRQASILPDEKHISDFYQAGFTEDYKFWRSKRQNPAGDSSYWNYSCPFCSCDEYVQAGVCSGVFESYLSSLKSGMKSCRCSNYMWTREQREYQITKVCSAKNYIFKGWEQHDQNKSVSKFEWVCSLGHYNSTRVDSFLRVKNTCKVCDSILRRVNAIGFGYYPSRVSEEDNLYIIKFTKGGYIKVGRSFCVKTRIPSLLRSSGHIKSEIEVLLVKTGTHQQVYDTEQWLHTQLTSRGFYHKESTWTVETFTLECESVLMDLLTITNLKSKNESG